MTRALHESRAPALCKELGGCPRMPRAKPESAWDSAGLFSAHQGTHGTSATAGTSLSSKQ